ncbi:hypothetical protein VNI00_011364 [Paramarasmius palmivorus]|uniref:Uncharacterized protein n=1 Tax=Paramarasmius palmivorus TaxID=297713 RepID=A0AAW0CCH2_9AGAR
MPKNRGKGRAKARQKLQAKTTQTTPSVCQTLDEDEITRCTQPATHGNPTPNRCESHHRQYCTLTGAYKDASRTVDEILGPKNVLPTLSEVSRYNDYHSALEKARWVRRYVEAIREEKIGREIHHRRFFLKVDDGHKIRLKVLAKQMRKTVELLNEIQRRAFDLYVERHPESNLVDGLKRVSLSSSLPEAKNDLSTENVLKAVEDFVAAPTPGPSVRSRPEGGRSEAEDSKTTEDDVDLIEVEIRRQKEQLLYVLELLYSREATPHHEDKDIDLSIDIAHTALRQYAFRIIFYEPVLAIKAVDRVSFEDLILSSEFSLEDLARFFILFQKRLEIGLLWWKDSMMEALAVVHSGDRNRVANMGNPGERVPILDGWIFNSRQKKNMSNEGWWHLIKSLEPIPNNVENRFVRLCNDFDDMEAFLSFVAFDMIKTPTRFRDENPALDCRISRNTLSLSGIVVADMVSSHTLPFIAPSTHRANRRGFRTWAEVESRAYIFGAVRNEDHDLTKRFFDELKARPDLFYVITCSETDPPRKLETFGGPGDGTTELGQIQGRKFEAPVSLRYPNNSVDRGEWQIARPAADILYGTDPRCLGYLASLERGGEYAAGEFFRFKQFPVKYFVVMDVEPHRHAFHVFRAAAWAALRAQRLVHGEYSELEYARASDVLFQRVAKERLSWMPTGYGGWSTTSYEDYVQAGNANRPEEEGIHSVDDSVDPVNDSEGGDCRVC